MTTTCLIGALQHLGGLEEGGQEGRSGGELAEMAPEETGPLPPRTLGRKSVLSLHWQHLAGGCCDDQHPKPGAGGRAGVSALRGTSLIWGAGRLVKSVAFWEVCCCQESGLGLGCEESQHLS